MECKTQHSGVNEVPIQSHFPSYLRGLPQNKVQGSSGALSPCNSSAGSDYADLT